MTLTAAQARELPRATPVLLVEITLRGSSPPTLYFSDRPIEVGGQMYEDYVSSIAGLGSEVRRRDSSSLNSELTIRFKNDRFRTYTRLIEIGDTYPFTGAVLTVKECWVDPVLGTTTAATQFVGRLEEPREIDLLSFTVRASSEDHYKAKLFSIETINLTDYPAANLEDVGGAHPVLFGQNIRIPIRAVRWGLVSTLTGEITAAQTTITISDAGGWPTSGWFWCGQEAIGFSGRTGNDLTSCNRGSIGTTPAIHGAGSELILNDDSYPFFTGLIGDIIASGSPSYLYGKFGESFVRYPANFTTFYEYGRRHISVTDSPTVFLPTDQGGGTAMMERLPERLYVRTTGAYDDTGDFGGVNDVVERPDWVIKFILVKYLGYSLSEIDGTSFSAAGTWYASNSYVVARHMWELSDWHDVVRRLAWEVRSLLYYRAGKWYLSVIPDTAPASVKTIDAGEVVGQGGMVRFNCMPLSEVANSLRYNYARNYMRRSTGRNFSGVGTVSSVVTGTDTLPGPELEFEWIRGGTMAASVATHMLTQSKKPYMSATLLLFWEHFDLNAGDTITITNAVFNNRKWFIERTERVDAHTVRVEALEWWS